MKARKIYENCYKIPLCFLWKENHIFEDGKEYEKQTTHCNLQILISIGDYGGEIAEACLWLLSMQ